MAGVQDPNSVDLITQTADGEYVLTMVEDRGWDGSDERIDELQTKILNYVSFALDGQLARLYPESQGRTVSLRLACTTEPDPSVQLFIDQIKPGLEGYGLTFTTDIGPA